MGWTAIDAHWWFGGNKRRGIGQYLTAYFQGHYHVPRTQRRWLVPFQAKDEEIKELESFFGGKAIRLPQQGPSAAWVAMLIQEGCHQVFFASPFERPTSLLDVWPLFSAAHVRGEAVVFDLLPLQFRQEILSTWPSGDQLQYQIRVEYLKNLDFLWCISPATAKATQRYLGRSAQRQKVLQFGLKDAWLEVPAEIEKHTFTRDKNLVVTISGGEWRKNLEGTIEYFLANFLAPARLVVVCKLGKKHLLALKWQLFLRGVLKRVQFAGEVSEDRKWQLLLEANDFLFLSHAEGLGIPLLEAQKAKVPNIYMSKALVQDGLGVLVDSPITVNA